MSDARGIVKNASLLLISDIVTKFLSFFLVIAIMRYLGTAGLGKYSFAFAFAGIFAIFADFGLSTYIIREVARQKERSARYLGNMLGIKLVLAVFILIISFITINIIEDDPQVRMSVYIVMLATALLGFNSLFGSLFAAFEKMEYSALVNVLERIFTVGLAVLLLWKGEGLIGLVVAYFVSYLLVFLISAFIAFRKVTRFSIRFETGFWKFLIKSSVPFWFTTIFITIYFRIDTVLLQMLTNYESVGYYNAAYKALDALYFIPSAIITAVFPAMSRMHVENTKLLQVLYERAFYYLVILAVPIAMGTFVLSSRIILLIYGKEALPASDALMVLIWAEAIIFVSSLVGYLLNAINKQLTFTYITAVAAVFNIAVNLVIIPIHGYIGAAYVTVATELLVLLCLYYFASKSGYSIDLVRTFLKPLLAGLVMAAVIMYFGFLHLLIIIPVGAAAYFAVLYLIRGIGKEEIDIAMQLKDTLLRK